MSRASKRRIVQRTLSKNVSRVKNMMLSGNGAGGRQDRGAGQNAAAVSSNPHTWTSPHQRYKEWTRWYETAWEARKIIDIPVEDALRKPFAITGIESTDAKKLKGAYDALNLDNQVKRALIQERLYGGSILLPILATPEGESMGEPLPENSVQENDLLAVNVIDVSKITQPTTNSNPFSPFYDRAESYCIQSVPVHISRMIVLDGSPLLNRSSRLMMTGGNQFNGTGFGESKLAPLYDLLVRVVGTQQGAYHLVNLASCLLLEVEDYIAMEASDSPALRKLREVVEQISMYRAACIDGKGARVAQHAANFGSVPELVMSFAQLLAAASDIPATRFLGQAPGGLNSTGDSDLENYYNMIVAYLRLRVKPIQLQLLSFVGASLWGPHEWVRKSQNIDIEHPSPWHLSEKETSELDKTYAEMIGELYATNLLDDAEAIAELKARGIFKTNIEAKEFLESHRDRSMETPVDTEGTLSQIEKLKGEGLAV